MVLDAGPCDQVPEFHKPPKGLLPGGEGRQWGDSWETAGRQSDKGAY